jgi:2-polyprenyl-3-methyl-5-hydroxy-6-metoxy-1,4-benzoquinol methylase
MAIKAHQGLLRRSKQVRDSLGRLLLVSRVARLSARTPKNPLVGWNDYWSGIRSTGVGGDVLWDTGDLDEIPTYLPQLREHLDPSLLLIDVGCGNGRFTRRLAAEFPSVMGLDLSQNAVALARREAAGAVDIDFRVLDLTVPGATAGLSEEFGAVNIFVRGVFHILNPADRAVMARNLLPLVGARGRVFLAETNFRGSSLGYLESLGAKARSIPEPLERAIRDLPRPGHFGAQERSVTFPPVDWELLDDGPTVIETIPLRGPTEPELIPGYYAVLAAR